MFLVSKFQVMVIQSSMALSSPPLWKATGKSTEYFLASDETPTVQLCRLRLCAPTRENQPPKLHPAPNNLRIQLQEVGLLLVRFLEIVLSI